MNGRFLPLQLDPSRANYRRVTLQGVSEWKVPVSHTRLTLFAPWALKAVTRLASTLPRMCVLGLFRVTRKLLV